MTWVAGVVADTIRAVLSEALPLNKPFRVGSRKPLVPYDPHSAESELYVGEHC